jgi:hypothetical protein
VKIVAIVIGMVVVAVVIVVGGLVWVANHKIALDDPKVRESFEASYTKSCVETAERRLTSAGKTVTDEMARKLGIACDCLAGEMAERAGRNGGFSLVDMSMQSSEFRAEMQDAQQACTAKLGTQGN